MARKKELPSHFDRVPKSPVKYWVLTGVCLTLLVGSLLLGLQLFAVPTLILIIGTLAEVVGCLSWEFLPRAWERQTTLKTYLTEHSKPTWNRRLSREKAINHSLDEIAVKVTDTLASKINFTSNIWFLDSATPNTRNVQQMIRQEIVSYFEKGNPEKKKLRYSPLKESEVMEAFQKAIIEVFEEAIRRGKIDKKNPQEIPLLRKAIKKSLNKALHSVMEESVANKKSASEEPTRRQSIELDPPTVEQTAARPNMDAEQEHKWAEKTNIKLRRRTKGSSQKDEDSSLPLLEGVTKKPKNVVTR